MLAKLGELRRLPYKEHEVTGFLSSLLIFGPYVIFLSKVLSLLLANLICINLSSTSYLMTA